MSVRFVDANAAPSSALTRHQEDETKRPLLHYIRYLNKNESVIGTHHDDMCAFATGSNPWLTPGRIPGNFYKMKARKIKRVRFALEEDNDNESENVENKHCDCKTKGKKCYCDLKSRDTQQERIIKARYRSQTQALTNGLSRQNSFTTTEAPSETSKALSDAIIRKTNGDAPLYSPRGSKIESPADMIKNSKTRIPLKAVISSDLLLGARSITSLLDEVLQDNARKENGGGSVSSSRFSRYRPVGAHESSRPRDSVMNRETSTLSSPREGANDRKRDTLGLTSPRDRAIRRNRDLLCLSPRDVTTSRTRDSLGVSSPREVTIARHRETSNVSSPREVITPRHRDLSVRTSPGNHGNRSPSPTYRPARYTSAVSFGLNHKTPASPVQPRRSRQFRPSTPRLVKTGSRV